VAENQNDCPYDQRLCNTFKLRQNQSATLESNKSPPESSWCWRRRAIQRKPGQDGLCRL